MHRKNEFTYTGTFNEMENKHIIFKIEFLGGQTTYITKYTGEDLKKLGHSLHLNSSINVAHSGLGHCVFSVFV